MMYNDNIDTTNFDNLLVLLKNILEFYENKKNYSHPYSHPDNPNHYETLIETDNGYQARYALELIENFKLSNNTTQFDKQYTIDAEEELMKILEKEIQESIRKNPTEFINNFKNYINSDNLNNENYEKK